MPDIDFKVTSAVTYKYYSGDYGGFRAFAGLDTGTDFDLENIDYEWKRNGNPILDAEFTDYSTYDDNMAIEGNAGKGDIFGVRSAILMTPPLLKENDADIYTCTAQHKDGGNIIIHTITIDFESEATVFKDIRRGEGGLSNHIGDVSNATNGWRSAYWDRIGTAGEVVQYGRLLVNINAAIGEKDILVDNGFVNRVSEVTDLTTRVIDLNSASPTLGGVTTTLGYYDKGDVESAEGLRAHSEDKANFVNRNANPGYAPRTEPITARMMHYLTDTILAMSVRYLNSTVSTGSVVSPLINPTDLLTVIAPTTVGVETTINDPTFEYQFLTPAALIPVADQPKLDDGYVIYAEKRAPYDYEKAWNPSIGVGEPAVGVDNRIVDAPNMKPSDLFEIIDHASVTSALPGSEVPYYLLSGTHRLRGETNVTVIRPEGAIDFSDPDTINGTKVKEDHFEALKEVLSQLCTALIKPNKGIAPVILPPDTGLNRITLSFNGDAKDRDANSGYHVDLEGDFRYTTYSSADAITPVAADLSLAAVSYDLSTTHEDWSRGAAPDFHCSLGTLLHKYYNSRIYNYDMTTGIPGGNPPPGAHVTVPRVAYSATIKGDADLSATARPTSELEIESTTHTRTNTGGAPCIGESETIHETYISFIGRALRFTPEERSIGYSSNIVLGAYIRKDKQFTLGSGGVTEGLRPDVPNAVWADDGSLSSIVDVALLHESILMYESGSENIVPENLPTTPGETVLNQLEPQQWDLGEITTGATPLSFDTNLTYSWANYGTQADFYLSSHKVAEDACYYETTVTGLPTNVIAGWTSNWYGGLQLPRSNDYAELAYYDEIDGSSTLSHPHDIHTEQAFWERVYEIKLDFEADLNHSTNGNRQNSFLFC